MIKWLVVVLFLLIMADSILARSEFSGKVVGVAEGDTIAVLSTSNRQVKVRLYGIDCPEKKQAFGQTARQFTRQKVKGDKIRVEVMGTDRYGRSVGVLYADNGRNLNRELLSAGIAWVYPQYCKAASCREWRELESRTKRAGVG